MGEVGGEFLMGGVVGEVLQFTGVGFVVVELGVGAGPFGVAIAFSAEAVAHEIFGAAGLGDGRTVPRDGGIVEEGAEAFSGEIGGSGDAAEIGERGVEIEELDGAAAGDAAFLLRGSGDDQGDPRAVFEEALFHQQAVLAEVVSVIAPENDDGAIGQAEAFDGIEQAADLRVDE